ncbi:hypothetical protein I4U23_013098 [Adineta vaga]|nr:hypothetical protein I4U23_013098 [Adineta vaga]
MGSDYSTDTFSSLTSVTHPRRLVQNFVLIWLDSSFDESTDAHQTNIFHLRRIVNTIHLFTNIEQCRSFLNELQNAKAFLIISGVLGRTGIPIIHEMSQLDSIYILCHIKYIHRQWIKQFSKIKEVYTTIPAISISFTRHAVHTNPNSIGIIFQMSINPSIPSAQCASLSKTSYYKSSEQEILFSMHTIFRIDDIKQIDVENDKFWQVDLTLTNDNDKQLSVLTEKI